MFRDSDFAWMIIKDSFKIVGALVAMVLLTGLSIYLIVLGIMSLL